MAGKAKTKAKASQSTKSVKDAKGKTVWAKKKTGKKK